MRPNQRSAVETVYAMTVHKSRGSQFASAAVVLSPPSSRILTRELLYTAVTRAQHHLYIVGTEEAVRAAVTRPAARASGVCKLGWRVPSYRNLQAGHMASESSAIAVVAATIGPSTAQP